MVNVTKAEGKPRCYFNQKYVLIKNHKPPFNKLSFAKVDGVYISDYFPDLRKKVLHRGKTLNDGDFKEIISKIDYDRKIMFTEEEIRLFNDFNSHFS
ncbi:hypothetical protein MmiEs2_15230 [Methanimicrococcus stummii]|uniref:Uncharacterized protein n=1 Tax=Methanimicrococcus stummii TaxID=3028294 RepID=A0AA96VNG1_9EURY|nr:hypothetical protein [Methanimicrococcus sp. Es2]WNY29297.1 hypothetical protein MmiEs2_15230 [Methanimicrococcus sp. Es2]